MVKKTTYRNGKWQCDHLRLEEEGAGKEGAQLLLDCLCLVEVQGAGDQEDQQRGGGYV